MRYKDVLCEAFLQIYVEIIEFFFLNRGIAQIVETTARYITRPSYLPTLFA